MGSPHSGGHAGDRWSAFWEADLELDLHRHWTDRFERRFHDLVGLGDDEVVLDFGAGTGDFARRVSFAARWVYTLDASERMSREAARRTRDRPNVTVLDPDADLDTLAHRPAGAPSLVVVNGVLHYLDADELPAVLERLGRAAAPRARLVLSDLIPRRYSRLRDTLGILRAVRADGLLAPTLVHIARLLVSHPLDNLRPGNLTPCDAALAAHHLEPLGYRVEERPNLGYSTLRTAVVAERSP